MKRLLLSAAIVLGGFAFVGTAHAAACGPVSTGSFSTVVTSITSTPIPCSGRQQCRQTRNKIRNSARATQTNINSGCSIMNNMYQGGIGLGNLGNFTNMFAGQLAQITNILNQAKALSNGNPTAAQVAQIQQLVAQAKSLSDQLLQQARQMAKQIAQSVQVNLN